MSEIGRLLSLVEIFTSNRDTLRCRAFPKHSCPCEVLLNAINDMVAAIAGEIELKTVDDLEALEALEARYAIDKRKLQRMFQRYVGTGPKWIIKRYRLHEVIAKIQECPVDDWAAFAQAVGYYDQAHFIRDFRTLVGKTPVEYANSILK